MHRVLLGFAAAVALGAAVFAALLTAPGSATALTDCDTNSADLDGAELEMLQLVNDARAASGAAPLAVSPNLNRAAAWKSEDAGSNGTYGFSHEDSLGRSPYERAPDCGYPTGAAENIAYGYPGAVGTFDAFMGSPGHRANIVNQSYVAIGIGRSGSAWTLNFGFVDDSDAVVTPQPTPTGTTAPARAPVQSTPEASATPTQAVVPAPATATATPQQPTPTATPTRIAPTPQPPSRNYGGRDVLTPGANLVSFSGPETIVESATASLGSSLVGVYWWDNVKQVWLHYFPGAPGYANTLKTLEPGRGYFLLLSEPANWTY